MNIKYFILILNLIFFGCTETEALSCPGGETKDQCGVCCDENSNLECSNGPNTGVMDACGTCFGEIQNEEDCIGLCTDPEAGNYNQPMYSLECPCNYNSILIEVANSLKNEKIFPFYISSNMPKASENNNRLEKKFKKINPHL